MLKTLSRRITDTVLNWPGGITRRLAAGGARCGGRSRRAPRPGPLPRVEALEGRALLSGAGVLTLGSASYAVSEYARALTVTVNRTGNLSLPLTLQYATADGTARAGSDYRAQAGTLRFAPGQTSQRLSIALTNDPHLEGDETF